MKETDKTITYSDMAFELAKELKEYVGAEGAYDALKHNEDHEFEDEDIMSIILNDTEYGLYEVLDKDIKRTIHCIDAMTYEVWYTTDLAEVGKRIFNNEVVELPKVPADILDFIDFEDIAQSYIDNGWLLENEGLGFVYHVWE